MDRVVLESPYAGRDGDEMIRNILYARRAVRDCVLRKEAPIASHLLLTQDGILRDGVPDERRLGIAAGLAWVEVADKMVLYTDYNISPGMKDACEYAEGLGVKVELRRIGKNPTDWTAYWASLSTPSDPNTDEVETRS